MYNNAGRVGGDAQDFVEEHPKTATAIAVAYIAIPIAIWAGVEASIAFLANEVKDEVLSKATGGVSDYADVTKMGRKGIQKVADSETAKKILNAPSKRKTPRTVTTIVDEDTGKIYTGTNQARKVEDLNSEVQKLLPNKSKEPWSCTNCSEVGAVNNAANDGAKVGKNLKAITNQVDKKTNTFRPIETCKNCKETTRNIDVLSDKY